MSQKEKLTEILKESNSLLKKFELDSNDGRYTIDITELDIWLQKIRKFELNEKNCEIKFNL